MYLISYSRVLISLSPPVSTTGRGRKKVDTTVNNSVPTQNGDGRGSSSVWCRCYRLFENYWCLQINDACLQTRSVAPLVCKSLPRVCKHSFCLQTNSHFLLPLIWKHHLYAYASTSSHGFVVVCKNSQEFANTLVHSQTVAVCCSPLVCKRTRVFANTHTCLEILYT